MDRKHCRLHRQSRAFIAYCNETTSVLPAFDALKGEQDAYRIQLLERDHQKRVNLPRIENYEPLPKHEHAAFTCQNVKTASARKYR